MIKIADFDVAKARQVLTLYKQNVGGTIDYLPPETFVEEVKSGEAFRGSKRLGSHWDVHSKLVIDHEGEYLRFGFNTNFAPRDRQGLVYQEATAAGKKFAEAANALT